VVMRWSWVLMTHLIGLVSDLLHCRTKAELPARAAAIDDHHSLVADNKAGIGDCGAFRTHALVGAEVDVTPGGASLTISGGSIRPNGSVLLSRQSQQTAAR
jgi:hypothetical protein